MATNATERIINHQDGLDIASELRGIKEAILARPSGEGSSVAIADLVANVRNGTAPTNYPVGTEITFDGNEKQVSTLQGNSDPETTAGVTGVTVDRQTYFAKAGGGIGTLEFHYDGASWRLGSASGSVADLTDYGITPQGTPVSGDFVSVSTSASSYTFVVADYDHYEPVNPAIKHTMCLIAKDVLKERQEWGSPFRMMIAVTKKELPAGKYRISIHATAHVIPGATDADYDTAYDGDYVFTTTKAIGVGGGLDIGPFVYGDEHSDDSEYVVTNFSVTSWKPGGKEKLEEDISLAHYSASADSDAVLLGTCISDFKRGGKYNPTIENDYGFMNFVSLIKIGDNAWPHSIIRQWLNADKPAGQWWKQVSIFDRMPDSLWPDQRDGFLYGLNAELKSHIVPVKVNSLVRQSIEVMNNKLGHRTGSNDYSLVEPEKAPMSDILNEDGEQIADVNILPGGEGGYRTYYVTEEKVFLASVMELDHPNAPSQMSSGYFDHFINKPLALYEGSDAEAHIKCYVGEPTKWWLRSITNVNGSNGIISIRETGFLYNSTQAITYPVGVAPIINIG